MGWVFIFFSSQFPKKSLMKTLTKLVMFDNIKLDHRKGKCKVKLHAIFSNQSGCGVSRVSEWDDIVLEEGTEQELREAARKEGFKYIHLFKAEEEEGNMEYTYLTTTTTEAPATGGFMWEAAQKEKGNKSYKLIGDPDTMEWFLVRVEQPINNADYEEIHGEWVKDEEISGWFTDKDSGCRIRVIRDGGGEWRTSGRWED